MCSTNYSLRVNLIYLINVTSFEINFANRSVILHRATGIIRRETVWYATELALIWSKQRPDVNMNLSVPMTEFPPSRWQSKDDKQIWFSAHYSKKKPSFSEPSVLIVEVMAEIQSLNTKKTRAFSKILVDIFWINWNLSRVTRKSTIYFIDMPW